MVIVFLIRSGIPVTDTISTRVQAVGCLIGVAVPIGMEGVLLALAHEVALREYSWFLYHIR